MPPWFSRSLVVMELSATGLLALLITLKTPSFSLTLPMVSVSITAAILLIAACVGLIYKVTGRWSTRILWEWIFIVSSILGGWLSTYILIDTWWASLVGAFLLLAPLFFHTGVMRWCVFTLNVAGISIFFARTVPWGALWTLWIGLALYDTYAKRAFMGLQQWLRSIAKRQRVYAWFETGAGEKTSVLVSHLMLSSALIVHATSRQPAHGVLLLAAFIIGAWYGLMQGKKEEDISIIPWAAGWMAGVEGVFLLLSTLSH